MIEVYRLSFERSAKSGYGAALHGGRWNLTGQEVIYASATRSLAALEVLAHNDVLPRNYVATRIQIPDDIHIAEVAESSLPPGWNDPGPPSAETQKMGSDWLAAGRTAVLSVPSAIIPKERNFVVNVAHPDFAQITFLVSEPFRFDARLK